MKGGMKGQQRSALGRGLGALLPVQPAPRGDNEFVACPLDRIDLHDVQPRELFDDEALAELAASIREHGVLQPILVSRDGDRFRLIAGERRVRASRLAEKTTIPAVVKELSTDDVFEVALIENIQREDLTPIEEAAAYKRLLDTRSYSQEDLARRVGKSRSAVANSLRLLQLDERSLGLVTDGKLSAGHARALLSIEPGDARDTLCDQILAEGLSVREAERRARDEKESRPTSSRPRAPRALSPLHDIIAQELGAYLEAPVRVAARSSRSGRIVIDYDSLESLRRIHARVLGQDETD